MMIKQLNDKKTNANNRINALEEQKIQDDDRIKELEKQLAIIRRRLATSKNECEILKIKYNSIINSTSWKITLPLRRVADRIKGNVKKDEEYEDTVIKEYHNHEIADFKLSEKKIVVLTTKHCMYIANLIKHTCERVGIDASVITERPQSGWADLPHIVICPNMFADLPELYVVFQMEQSNSSAWFTEEYFAKLESAAAILDYSLENIEYLQENGFSVKNIYYVPISVSRDYESYESCNKKCDIAFYGAINSRRQEILEYLQRYYKVNILTEVYGEKLYQELSKAKLILNIHYYENAMLETTRICESLSLKSGIVISEKAYNDEEYKDLSNICDMVSLDNIEELKSHIDRYLCNNDLYDRKMKEIKCTINDDNVTSFEYYFYRFLLATDNISFETFYNMCGSFISFKGDFWGLGLPETVKRHKAFDQSNKYGIEYFPGLRHHIGWIGCGLSYKFMMKKAKELRIGLLTICEDDVELDDVSFEREYRIIKEYLMNHKNEWDVFNGMIADVNKNTKITNIESYKGIEFTYLDKMTSMLCNIYHPQFFSFIENWDENCKDVNKNAIDRYIENKEKLTVITKIPWLAGQKNSLQSTLWGGENTIYSDMINESNKRIKEKTDKFKQQKKIRTNERNAYEGRETESNEKVL